MKLRARQQARFSALYVAVAVIVLIFLQSWLLTPQAQEIPMSQLIEWVREGRVVRVSFGEREIRGALREPPADTPAPSPRWEKKRSARQRVHHGATWIEPAGTPPARSCRAVAADKSRRREGAPAGSGRPPEASSTAASTSRPTS